MNEIKEKLSVVGKYLPALLTVLMLILLTQRLAELTWKLWPAEADKASPVAKQQVNLGSSPKAAPANTIASWHLFGVAKKANNNKVVPTSAPETRLRLILKGVYASEGSPSAIIAGANGQEIHYAVGERLPGGAILREVYGDRVILERQGRYETLSLQRHLLNQKELIITQ